MDDVWCGIVDTTRLKRVWLPYTTHVYTSCSSTMDNVITNYSYLIYSVHVRIDLYIYYEGIHIIG